MFTRTPAHRFMLTGLGAVAFIAAAVIGLISQIAASNSLPLPVASVSPDFEPGLSAPKLPELVETVPQTTPEPAHLTGEAALAGHTDAPITEWAAGVLASLAEDAPSKEPVVAQAVPAPTVAARPAAEVASTPPTSVAGKTVVADATTDTPSNASVQAAPYAGEVVAEDVGEPTDVASNPTTSEVPAVMQSAGWVALRSCESGGNYQINTGNGFYGAYQFTIGTWNAVAELFAPDYVGVSPHLAPPAVQDQLAFALRYEIAWGGWQHWPICGRYVA